MKVLMIRVNQAPVLEEIAGDLASMQKAVGGYIQVVYPWDDLIGLVCNEEGKLIGLPDNRPLLDEETGLPYDIVAGDFFLAGLTEDDFCDFPVELVERYTRLFAL